MLTKPDNPIAELVQPSNRRFETSDLDEAREMVSQVYCDHELSSTTGQVDAFHYHLPLHGVSLNYMSYGPEAIIEPGMLNDFYLIQLPLKGTATIEADGRLIDTHPGRAVVIDPTSYTRMVWSEGCEQVLVQISKELMNRMSGECLQESGGQHTRFVDFMDNKDERHMAWWRHLFSFVREYGQDYSVYKNEEIARTAIESLVKSFLYQVDNNHSSRLLGNQKQLVPKHVRSAQQFLQDHFSDHLVVEDLVKALHVSERSLFEGFRKFSNTTPMKFLLDVRLNEAHNLLKKASAGESITDIALSCGFTQLGRFSRLYHERYGELPSHTLKSARNIGQ